MRNILVKTYNRSSFSSVSKNTPGKVSFIIDLLLSYIFKEKLYITKNTSAVHGNQDCILQITNDSTNEI